MKCRHCGEAIFLQHDTEERSALRYLLCQRMRCLICMKTFLAPIWQQPCEFNEEDLRNDPRSPFAACERRPGVPARLQTIEPLRLPESAKPGTQPGSSSSNEGIAA